MGTLSDAAHHEAAHGVLQSRSAVGRVTIIPSDDKLGSLSDAITDSFSEGDCQARVLSCYAGAHSDRRRGCFNPTQCVEDDYAAAEILKMWGWEDQEQFLRDESKAIVDKHWPEIEFLANELMTRKSLDMTEIEMLIDIAAGDVHYREDLAAYREMIA